MFDSSVSNTFRTLVLGEGFLCLFLLLMVAKRFLYVLGRRSFRTKNLPTHIFLMILSYLTGLILVGGIVITRFDNPLSFVSIMASLFYSLGIAGLIVMLDGFKDEINR